MTPRAVVILTLAAALLVSATPAAAQSVVSVGTNPSGTVFPAHLAVYHNMLGHLASAGLGWSDVKVICARPRAAPPRG